MIKALLLSTLALNFGLFLGRLSGFLREAFVASTYGTTGEADIIVQMLTVPDLLVNILIGGAMGVVLIPEFTQHHKHAQQLLYQSALFFGGFFLLVAVGLYWQTELLVRVLAPGFTEQKVAQTASVVSWVVWLVPLTVLSGVVTAFLHAQNKFAVAALGTLIINGAIILGLLLSSLGHGSLFLVAVFLLLGGFLRLLSQVLLVRTKWTPWKSLTKWRLNRSLLVRYAQAMLSGSALLLFPVVARAIASYEAEGSVALFNYASRLVEFPLSIAVTFLAVVLFPRLAQSYANDSTQHRQLIQYGVQITIGLSIVAASTLIVMSHSYADFAFGYGDMDATAVSAVASLIMIGLLALPFQGISGFLTAVFNARKDTRTPLLLNIAGLVFFIATSNMGLFGQGLTGLMWGIVTSYGVICCLQLIFLRIEGFKWRNTLLNSSFCLSGVAAIILSVFSSLWVEQLNLPAWLSLIIAGFFGVVSLVVMALFNDNMRVIIKAKLSIK